MNKRVRKFLGIATKLARKLERRNTATYYFCGILAKGNSVLNFGFNHPYKTHPRATNKYRKIHCELDCILGVSEEDIHNATLYLVRVGYDNRAHWLLSKPCIHCQAMLKHAGVRCVYFTINDNVIGKWDIRSDKWSIFNKIDEEVVLNP